MGHLMISRRALAQGYGRNVNRGPSMDELRRDGEHRVSNGRHRGRAKQRRPD